MFFLLCQELLLVALAARSPALLLPNVLLLGKHCLKHLAISPGLVFNKSLTSFVFPTSFKDSTEKSLDGEIGMFCACGCESRPVL